MALCSLDYLHPEWELFGLGEPSSQDSERKNDVLRLDEAGLLRKVDIGSGRGNQMLQWPISVQGRNGRGGQTSLTRSEAK